MISTFKSLKKHKYLVLALYDSIFLLHSPIVFSALARDLPFIYLQKWPKKNDWIVKLFFNVKRSLCTSCCHSSPWKSYLDYGAHRPMGTSKKFPNNSRITHSWDFVKFFTHWLCSSPAMPLEHWHLWYMIKYLCLKMCESWKGTFCSRL